MINASLRPSGFSKGHAIGVVIVAYVGKCAIDSGERTIWLVADSVRRMRAPFGPPAAHDARFCGGCDVGRLSQALHQGPTLTGVP